MTCLIGLMAMAFPRVVIILVVIAVLIDLGIIGGSAANRRARHAVMARDIPRSSA